MSDVQVDEEFLVGRPEILDDVDITFDRVDTPVIRRAGRPKGSKSRETIFKEQMQNQFERKLKSAFRGVLDKVVEEARGGDMQAARMIMDRVVPVSKAIDLNDLEKAKGMLVNINIGALESKDIVKTIEKVEEIEETQETPKD